jgi:hypothetical protein
MKSRLFFPTMSLLAILLASSCAPAETPPPALPVEESAPVAAAPSEAPPLPEATAIPPTPAADIQVVPTSLGPNLHATNPDTVSLASGGLQLVEFFRFT